MDNDENKDLYNTSDIIYCLCLLKDKKISLGLKNILVFEPKFSKLLFSIKNKYNEPIYEIILSKRGPIICSQNNLIKVYSIFSDYYNLMLTIKRNNERIYKLREISNCNIAYSTIDSKIFLFQPTFKHINFDYDLDNKKVINFIERRNNQLILLSVKINTTKNYINPWVTYNNKIYYFYLKTLEKENESSNWKIKDKFKISTEKNINYFVTSETMKLSSKNYLLVAIGRFLHVYHITDDDEFIFCNNISFKGNEFIQSICLFKKNILAIGCWSGNICFIENDKLLTKKNVKKTNKRNTNIRNLIKLDEDNIICIEKRNGFEVIRLINNINKKLK